VADGKNSNQSRGYMSLETSLSPFKIFPKNVQVHMGLIFVASPILFVRVTAEIRFGARAGVDALDSWTNERPANRWMSSRYIVM
jgi:hypothetical protein